MDFYETNNAMLYGTNENMVLIVRTVKYGAISKIYTSRRVRVTLTLTITLKSTILCSFNHTQ